MLHMYCTHLQVNMYMFEITVLDVSKPCRDMGSVSTEKKEKEESTRR
jgi:hypothetical protein